MTDYFNWFLWVFLLFGLQKGIVISNTRNLCAVTLLVTRDYVTAYYVSYLREVLLEWLIRVIPLICASYLFSWDCLSKV